MTFSVLQKNNTNNQARVISIEQRNEKLAELVAAIKKGWREDRTILNCWLTIPSAWTAELIANTGFDVVTIDMQHGLADSACALSMMQAIRGSDVLTLVRVRWNEPGHIMGLLDTGADGIICPMINSRAECEAFISACRYPPLGYRSYGPIRASLTYGQDYYATANENVITLAMVESVQALENLDEIAATPGLNGIYVGTVDLSISMGLSELGNPADPKLNKALNRILISAQSNDIIVGIHASSSELAASFSRRGFSIVTIVNDSELLRESARERFNESRHILQKH